MSRPVPPTNPIATRLETVVLYAGARRTDEEQRTPDFRPKSGNRAGAGARCPWTARTVVELLAIDGDLITRWRTEITLWNGDADTVIGPGTVVRAGYLGPDEHARRSEAIEVCLLDLTTVHREAEENAAREAAAWIDEIIEEHGAEQANEATS